MKNRTLIYGLTGLLTSSVITGLLITNNTQAQSPNSQHNTHHPSAQTNPSRRGMMTEIDQHFIEMMIPHHQQAVEMSDLALTRAKRPEINKLALAIKTDQNREIQQMRTWYKAWYGKDVPAVSMNNATMMSMRQNRGQGMNPGMMQMSMHPGMRGMEIDLEALKNAQDFDLEFISQMIPHHQMAVMMAQMVVNSTTKPEIRNLAQSIIKTQKAEIAQMRQWYQAWYKPTPTQSQQ
ncbi:MAG: DUF305 domain-containing protein [Hapalosiphonaceae cyanobacterium JJU2]|nr:MAG: DUF305 domain-containing protein [Hapalosiphonaceae cyanobacterium JJU2]